MSGAFSDQWLDVADVARHLSFSRDYTRKNIVTQPDFPAPARIGGHGQPRWKRSEIDAWMEGWRVSQAS
jgi:predicted DNA-binding transcriptional regulator AlpA